MVTRWRRWRTTPAASGRRGFLKRSGSVQVVIGPAIDSRGKTAEEIRKLAEEWIEKTMVELEGKQAV